MANDETPPAPSERPSVDYLLRTTQQNLVHLSGMADQKANIVLGASLIMITIIVTIASSSGITASMATLGGFAVASSITALLAVMPSTGKNPGSIPNPLYFGDVAYMTEAEHRHAMAQVIDLDGCVYDSILRDVHTHSQVLQHGKFRYLRYSYILFIVGLISTTSVLGLEWVTNTI